MPFADKDQAKTYYKERLRKKQEFIDGLKNAPCVDCGGVYPPYVMQFDHVPERGERKFSISSGANCSLKEGSALLEELKKCDLVCANCHAVRTHERGQNKRA